MPRPHAVKLWQAVTHASRQQSSYSQSRFFSNSSIRQPSILKFEDIDDLNSTSQSQPHSHTSFSIHSSSFSASTFPPSHLSHSLSSNSHFHPISTSSPQSVSSIPFKAISASSNTPIPFHLPTHSTISKKFNVKSNETLHISDPLLNPVSTTITAITSNSSSLPSKPVDRPYSSNSLLLDHTWSSVLPDSSFPIRQSAESTFHPALSSSNFSINNIKNANTSPSKNSCTNTILIDIPAFSNQILKVLQPQSNNSASEKSRTSSFETLTNNTPSTASSIIEHLFERMHGFNPIQQREFCFQLFEETALKSQKHPSVLSKLQILAQRLFARLGDLEGLRLWKKKSLCTFLLNASSSEKISPPSMSPKTSPQLSSSDSYLSLASPPFIPTASNHRPCISTSTTELHTNFSPIPPQASSSSSAFQNDSLRTFLQEKSELLLHHVKKNQLQEARSLFSYLTSLHFTPVGEATQAYFELLAKSHMLTVAMEDFWLLKKIESQTTPSTKLKRHHYFLYNAALSACCIAHDAHQALQLYDHMKNGLGQLPDLRTVTKLFSLLAKQKELTPMLNMLQDLHDHGITPYPLLFNLTLSQCVEKNLFEQAQTVFQQMLHFNVMPTAVTYSTLIKGALNNHLLHLAECYFQSMIHHPKATSPEFMNSMGPFHGLLQYYVQNNMSQRVRPIFDIYVQHFDQCIAPTGFTFYLLVCSCMQQSSSLQLKIESALSYLRDMVQKYHLTPSNHHFLPILQALHQDPSFLSLEQFVRQYMRSEFFLSISVPEAYDLIRS